MELVSLANVFFVWLAGAVVRFRTVRTVWTVYVPCCEEAHTLWIC